jgi:hypothetical protein
VEASLVEVPKDVVVAAEVAGAASFQEQSVSYVVRRGTTSSSASRGLICHGPDHLRRASPLRPHLMV